MINKKMKERLNRLADYYIKSNFNNWFQKQKHRGMFGRLVIYIILIVISYEILLPVFVMISRSFMVREDIIDPTVNWIPSSWTFHNFRIAWDVLNMPIPLLNSIWFSGMLAFFQTSIAAFTGFAFSRFDFKLKKMWFFMVILAFILPLPLLIIPRNMIFVSLQETLGIQMIGTVIPQALMAILGQGVHSTILILVFYNFMQMIPKTLDEAAEIDGANRFQVFVHIGVLLSKSTVLVVFLLSMVWNWNETFMTNTFLRNRIPLLPVNLGIFETIFTDNAPTEMIPGLGHTALINEAFRLSATLTSIIPLIILYLIVQRQFIRGIENTGITGE
jgi:multiple sugar transport system permease protein